MFYGASTKLAVSPPASFTNGATASLVIDTLNWAAADIAVVFSASNNSTNVPSVFKLQQSDITNSTGYSDVTGGSFTSAYTTANTVVTNSDTLAFSVDMRGKARYLKVLASPVTTQVVSIVANLYRGGLEPATAAARNLAGWLVL